MKKQKAAYVAVLLAFCLFTSACTAVALPGNRDTVLQETTPTPGISSSVTPDMGTDTGSSAVTNTEPSTTQQIPPEETRSESPPVLDTQPPVTPEQQTVAPDKQSPTPITPKPAKDSPQPKPPSPDTVKPPPSADFPSLPQFWFGSGVGGWSTTLDIYQDGTFSGYFHDSDMGDIGPGYPEGTMYECIFNGKFTELVKINEYEYSMRVEYMVVEDAEDRIENDIRIIPSGPYGFDDADEFRLYLPGRKTRDLPEQFLSWVGMAFWGDTVPEELPFYGLYNVGGEQGYSG